MGTSQLFRIKITDVAYYSALFASSRSRDDSYREFRRVRGIAGVVALAGFTVFKINKKLNVRALRRPSFVENSRWIARSTFPHSKRRPERDG